MIQSRCSWYHNSHRDFRTEAPKAVAAKVATKVMKRLKELEVEVKRHDRELEDVSKKIAIIESSNNPTYLFSDKCLTSHILTPHVYELVKTWRCWRGWKYVSSKYERQAKISFNAHDAEETS